MNEWRPVERQKEVVLVTGSSGLIGSAVVRRLAERFHVIGFDREAPPHPPSMAECITVDVTSDESVRQGLQRVRERHGERIASVIHLAAYYDFSGGPSPLYEEVTVRGTERLLRALQEFRVEQFVFSSTMLVHAPGEPGRRIDEDSPLGPTWEYPRSKVETERLLRSERGDIPVVLLRIAGVYDDQCHSIPLARQIQRIYERQVASRLFPGSPAHGQSFLHLDDLVDAFDRVVERRADLPPELPLLLGEPETLSYGRLQDILGHLIHGQEWTTLPVPEPLATAGAWAQDKNPLGEEPFVKPWMIPRADDHYELDISRARTLLGWEPAHSLGDTLPRMISALQADPLGWYRENHLDPPRELEEGTSANDPEQRGHGGEAQARARGNVGGAAKEDHGSMAMRGVTRPMMGDMGDMGDMGEMGEMSYMEEMTPAAREEMLERHHQNTLWVPLLVALLGVWLISSPFTLGYGDVGLAGSEVARVTAERGLPSIAARGAALVWSDVISGLLLVVLGLLSLSARRFWAPWAACFVGIWLLFAPLFLWSPSAAVYFNDTLVGALVIALTVLIPGMPGMIRIMKMGPEIPAGWSYNPSSWLQRAPVIALAWVGFFLSRHLTAYQMGYIDTAWDPFFGGGTMRVLDSDVSHAFPISDAGLGTVAYTIEALMGYMGGPARWRTMPWMVTFFGILVVPLGVVSITLVILQPVMVGAWATLALGAAIAMLVMIPLTVDEVVAMGQFLAKSRREGKSLWHTFWKGDTVEGGGSDERSPRFTAPVGESGPAMVWGVTVPGTLLASTLLGIWIMAAPAIFGAEGTTADNNYLVGALITTVAVVAMGEVTRAARYLNVPLGAWIIAVPWLLGGAGTGMAWSNAIVGSAVILLSFPRGPVRERYGSWDRYVI